MFHFVREADDSAILEELLNNSESNPAKSKAETVYKPAYNLQYQTKVARVIRQMEGSTNCIRTNFHYCKNYLKRVDIIGGF